MRGFKHLIQRCLGQILLILALLPTPSYLSANGFDGICKKYLKVVGNVDLKADPNTYKHPNSRNLEDLQSAVSPELVPFLGSLQAGAQIVDLGGGYSIYGIELARKGFQVITIDFHDYYALIEELSQNRSLRDNLNKAYYLYASQIGGVKVAALENLAEIYKIPLPSFVYIYELGKWQLDFKQDQASESEVQEMKSFLQHLLKRVSLESNFHRRQGDAVKALGELKKESTHLIIDSSGAFIKGNQQLEIIDSAYSALRRGGRAYLHYYAPHVQVKTDSGSQELSAT